MTTIRIFRNPILALLLAAAAESTLKAANPDNRASFNSATLAGAKVQDPPLIGPHHPALILMSKEYDLA